LLNQRLLNRRLHNRRLPKAAQPKAEQPQTQQPTELPAQQPLREIKLQPNRDAFRKALDDIDF
jgi:hypothetical protein